ncbi:uncharacterized protein F5891DRAFT_1186395 [Suillus fuscotomentosus]|uniref:Uncharacterized protein n=1 Tax=Suillus fuscotomentosus TaxID=1912939 RepID=A0AAD4EAC1_9AGAM|nr:uncharacterized protein F5891DRAFT_1186395 [Suillus fuscotomentosus]KAG1902297.1 hypothetical protein F5891DRAFT_1186395 [Suillus fuscotomentosus]
MILLSPHASSIEHLTDIIPDTSIALYFLDVLEKVVMEFRTQRSSNNFLTLLCSDRLLKGLRVAVSSEQATTLHEEAPPIARTSQESEAETAKPTLGKLGWSIGN